MSRLSTAPKTFGLSGRKRAAPSWVLPGTIEENARFLAGFPGLIQEVGLCCFESVWAASGEMGAVWKRISPLPFSWHVHLPTDLPWEAPEEAARCALALMRDIARPLPAVLHPPTGERPEAGLRAFINAWRAAGREPADLLLENVRGVDLAGLLPLMEAEGLSVCLDAGHALAFAQTELLEIPRLIRRVRLLHLHAPGNDPAAPDGHLPLTRLTSEQAGFCRRLLARAPAGAPVLVEVFDWIGYGESLAILEEWEGEPAP